jgi:hypothetical protein
MIGGDMAKKPLEPLISLEDSKKVPGAISRAPKEAVAKAKVKLRSLFAPRRRTEFGAEFEKGPSPTAS